MTRRREATEPIDHAFWESVARGTAHTAPDDYLPDWTPSESWSPENESHDPDLTAGVTLPCAECGETGACAYDIEGRPLIHAHGWT